MKNTSIIIAKNYILKIFSKFSEKFVNFWEILENSIFISKFKKTIRNFRIILTLVLRDRFFPLLLVLDFGFRSDFDDPRLFLRTFLSRSESLSLRFFLLFTADSWSLDSELLSESESLSSEWASFFEVRFLTCFSSSLSSELSVFFDFLFP